VSARRGFTAITTGATRCRDRHRAEEESSGARRQGGIVPERTFETPEIVGGVDVVPARETRDAEPGARRALHRRPEHLRRAPRDALEEARMHGAHPDEVVSAVARGTEHDVRARVEDQRRRSPQIGRRHGRDVGPEEQRGGESATEHSIEHGRHPRPEIPPALPDQ
jgi:hypothetical protein